MPMPKLAYNIPKQFTNELAEVNALLCYEIKCQFTPIPEKQVSRTQTRSYVEFTIDIRRRSLPLVASSA
jgi:hypothetical protein